MGEYVSEFTLFFLLLCFVMSLRRFFSEILLMFRHNASCLQGKVSVPKTLFKTFFSLLAFSSLRHVLLTCFFHKTPS